MEAGLSICRSWAQYIKYVYFPHKNLLDTELFRIFANKLNIMATVEKKARFDTKLPKEQKMFFERAARLGGYRSLTDFVILAAQSKAKEIIEEREQVLASNRDSEIFFDAITNAAEPNKELIDAANEYKTIVSK
jgi:uncharacterized protein (DUF1778 family)